MSTKKREFVEGDSQKFREADASDIGASEAPRKHSTLVQEDSPLGQSKPRVPEEVRRAVHRRSIAERVREDHDGNGYVILNTGTGGVVDIVDDLREGRSVIESADLSSDKTLIISCNER